MSSRKCRKFEDTRGTLYFPIKEGKYADNTNCNLRECTYSVNTKNVLRGLHINSFAKVITCISGSFIDFIVDYNKSIPTVKYIYLKPGDQVTCPGNHAHGFLSLEDNSVLSYFIEAAFENEVGGLLNYKDPILDILSNIPVKEHEIIINEKDSTAPYLEYDYFIIGGYGFIGSNIYRTLIEQNKKVRILNYRMNQLESIEYEIKMRKPKYFICAAGLTGTPNTSWCDTHRKETLMTNVIEQVSLLNLCNKYNIHCTLIGSGCIFNNKNSSYTNKDTGNDFSNYYAEARIQLEYFVKEFNNCLFLRINYPYSFQDFNKYNTKNLITKLSKYEKIENCNLSATNLDYMLPDLSKLIEENKTGILNFVDNKQINTVKLIQEYYSQNNIEFNKKIVESNRFSPLLLNYNTNY